MPSFTFTKSAVIDAALAALTQAIGLKADASSVASKAPTASPTFTGTVSGVTKAHVGLDQANNTSDANKPVSFAMTTALAGKVGTTTGVKFEIVPALPANDPSKAGTIYAVRP